MNGPQHYAEADQILRKVKEESTRLAAQSDMSREGELDLLQAVDTSLRMAQVHATLAAAAATIDALPPSEQAVNNAWKSVTA